jgi:hypothetical protein
MRAVEEILKVSELTALSVIPADGLELDPRRQVHLLYL